ncbi:MAG: AAA family ATPase [candidate division Zixibacteria bacterium]|nr:AAA family ATPase [candidate division Zixibacteria bacterium]
MATKRKTVRRPPGLNYADLDYRVADAPRGVKSTDDFKASYDIIGQDRAINAIRVGLHVPSRGYNVFVTGMSGTGRSTTITRLLEQIEHISPRLLDICYVNNFKNVDNPRVLMFKAGDGKRFKRDMRYLIDSLRKVVPKIFLSEDYKDRHSRIVREFENRQKELIQTFEDKLTAAGFVMVQVQSGLGVRNEIQPLIAEEPASLDKLERLVKEGKFSAAHLDELRRRWDSLRRDFDLTSVESKKLSGKLDDAIEKLNHSQVEPLVTDKVNLLKKRYATPKAIAYLEEVEEALTNDLDRYQEAGPRRGEDEAPAFRRREPFEEFAVNLILDNSSAAKVPIVLEKSPSYKNLFGSMERVVDRHGYWRTDFTRIFGGSLLKASGGFLVVSALDVLIEPGVWTHLKRALRNGEMEVAAYDPFSMMAGSGIKPEPIPVEVKVVLIGEPWVYRALWQMDDEFKTIFKVKSEFDSVMPYSRKNIHEYYRFMRRIVDNDHLLTFDLSAMQAVAEYGRRLAGHREKLTARFTLLADIMRESDYHARARKGKAVTRADVENAVVARRTRVNLVEDKVQEMFDTNMLLVTTSGSTVGQINGLSVYMLGEYSFGRPSRITVNTSLGKAGVINIEREAELSGPIHTKGVAVLSGYLRETFAQDKPLVMSASITFEQSYGGVDGDSASSAEVYGILSSLTGVPIDQGIAVTGSVNQKGEIQPIGGVNEKIEGFFDVCKSRGLTGRQGVMIPHQNVQDLLLRPDVMHAVKAKKFHLWPVRTINEGIEILTGHPGGKRLTSGKFTPHSIFAMADDKLRRMALAIDRFGHDEKDANNNGEAKKSGTGARRNRRKNPRRPRGAKRR